MYTLQDIYNRLNDGTPGEKRTGPPVRPVAGPSAGTMRSLNDIMDAAPGLDNTTAPRNPGDVPGRVLEGEPAASRAIRGTAPHSVALQGTQGRGTAPHSLGFAIMLSNSRSQARWECPDGA